MTECRLMGIRLLVSALCFPMALSADDTERLASIPRVDVHAHVGGDADLMNRYLEVSIRLKDLHQINLDIWIDLGSYRHPKKLRSWKTSITETPSDCTPKSRKCC